MLDIEIDGKQIQVPDGSTIMDAATKIGAFIPHFCYHKKLSIAANCRMCLVQVEKAPKPLPACATPVTNGMKVWTHSDAAVNAQKGVMEFLLINHPLDCPICDQGGECQLQDLSVGYGAPGSRYKEEKRVVTNKDMGPLIATDMTRCIHCTRCVRFTQEIAGQMEIGQAFRGEHAEIMPFIEKTVNSELSGNVIDLCPVGALTSKPFRFSARTWELSRRKSVSPHDSHGSNLVIQTKLDKVYRVLPLENEEVNECWLSDKDRFSYDGLNSSERLTKPLIKQCGEWREVEWKAALEFVATDLKRILVANGSQSLGALASPHSTLEELHLLQKLVRSLGSDNVDFRLRRSDFSLDGKRQGAPWLGMKIAEVASLDRILVVGSFLRKDHPLLALRIRQAAKRRAQVSVIHSAGDDLLITPYEKAVVPPTRLVVALAEVVKAVAQAKGTTPDASVLALLEGQVSESARRMADSLMSGQNAGIFLGNFAEQSASASTLQLLAQELGRLTGARFGYFGEAANSVGGYVAGALPKSGKNAREMLASPLKAYFVLHAEPDLDCHNPQQARAALKQADLVVALSPFRTRALDYATVILPVSPFSETSGTFISTEGRVQSFNAVVRPLGETRPAWKVLRVLGNLMGLVGFEQESSESVRAEMLGPSKPEFVTDRLSNSVTGASAQPPQAKSGMERIADVPIYFADPLVRRSAPLQEAADAAQPRARMNAKTLARTGAATGERVRVRQGGGEVVVEACLDEAVPDGCVRLAAAHPLTADLGDMQGELTVERV